MMVAGSQPGELRAPPSTEPLQTDLNHVAADPRGLAAALAGCLLLVPVREAEPLFPGVGQTSETPRVRPEEEGQSHQAR